MSLLAVAWRNLLNRALQSLMTVLVVGVALALALAIVLLSQGVQNGINRAAEPYDLIIGGKGSAQQLVLNTVLLQGDPLQNVPFDLYEKLQQDPGLTAVVPLGYGDNYRKLKIIGTLPKFFEFRNKPTDPPYFQVEQGRVFQQPFEAVLGAEAAHKLGLTPGQTFQAEHGNEEALPGEEQHDEHTTNPYKVVGILKPTNSPADLGIYVDIASYWKIHEHAGDTNIPVGDPTGPQAVTAILVKPRTFPNDLYRIQQQINSGRLTRDAQAVIPYNELYNLNQMVGQGQQILSFVAYLAIAMAGATVFLSLYGAIVERRRDLAVLRALGAGRRRVFSLVLVESGLVAGLGVILGAGLGHLTAWLISNAIRDANAIQIILGFPVEEPFLLLAVLLVGLLAGILPAMAAYRMEASRYLAPA
jgi:putative ABC transport system permease protein